MSEEKTISSQVFTKNGRFEILEKYSNKIDSKYIYKVKLKCNVCGKINIIDATHKERTVCSQCKLKNKTDEYIGKTFGVYTIIEFNSYKEEYGQTNRYYKVICNICSSISIQNLNHIKNQPKSCSNCKYEQRSLNNKPTLQSVINCVKSTYISGAKSRNLNFELSNIEFENLIFGECFYCGTLPKKYKSDERFNNTDENFERNGIDRLDSIKGYTKENTVSCCSVCNLMKMSIPYDIFINHVTKINSHLVNKGSTTILKGSTSQVNGDGKGRLLEKEDDIV